MPPTNPENPKGAGAKARAGRQRLTETTLRGGAMAPGRRRAVRQTGAMGWMSLLAGNLASL